MHNGILNTFSNFGVVRNAKKGWKLVTDHQSYYPYVVYFDISYVFHCNLLVGCFDMESENVGVKCVI